MNSKEIGMALIGIVTKRFPDSDIKASPSSVGSTVKTIIKKEMAKGKCYGVSSVDEDDALQNFLQKMIEYKFSNVNDPEHFLASMYRCAATKSMDMSFGESKKVMNVDHIHKSDNNNDDSDNVGTVSDVVSDATTPDIAYAKMAYTTVMKNAAIEFSKTLSDNEKSLFDLVYVDGIGDILPGVEKNAKQAIALKERRPDVHDSVVGKNSSPTRWSMYVNHLRESIKDKLVDYYSLVMSNEDRDCLRSSYLYDTDPSYLRRRFKSMKESRDDHWAGIDERKVSRLKWKISNKLDTNKDVEEWNRLYYKLTESGIDALSIPAFENPKPNGWKLHKLST